MHYTLPWLLAQVYSSEPLKYLFFWGHQPARDGAITANCFSQWWAGHPFEADGIRYATSEHYMMAAKARLFGDHEVAQKILAAASPGEAKDLGRQVRDFDQPTWEQHRLDIVVAGNQFKFSQHPELARFLKNTGDRILVEASPVDPIWGIGLAQDHPHAAQPENWQGLNLLGFALMEVRDRIR